MIHIEQYCLISLANVRYNSKSFHCLQWHKSADIGLQLKLLDDAR